MTTTTDELLAKLEAATTYSDYIEAVALVEQRANTLTLNGHFAEANAVRAAWKRIAAVRGPIVTASYGKGRIYSLEECAAYQAKVNATRRAEHVAKATSFVLTALSSNRPVVREDVHPVAAE